MVVAFDNIRWMIENKSHVLPSISNGYAREIEERYAMSRRMKPPKATRPVAHHPGRLSKPEIEWHEHKGLKLDCVSGWSQQRRAVR